MTFEFTRQITLNLIALFFIISSVEFLKLSKRVEFFQIWNYQWLRIDLQRGLPLPEAIIRFLFSNRFFQVIQFIQIGLAFLLFFFPSPWLVLPLFIIHLLICVRFRGTFNGGSDMMIFVLLTGALIFTAFQSQENAKLGFVYIAIHGIFSYFKAGVSKFMQGDWRSGFALPAFLQRSLFQDIKELSIWLAQRRNLSQWACWLVIIFEIGVLMILLVPKLAMFYFILALFFHFSVFLTFGLNRFFWVWLAAWPSIFYSLVVLGLTAK